MNPVDAAEELLAVGRRLQALERQLRQPVVALAAVGAWRELAADPVARLADLLAPYANPAHAPQPPVPARASSPYRREARPAAPHGVSLAATVLPGEMDGVVPTDRFQFAESGVRDAAGESSWDRPEMSDPQRPAEPVQPDGVRLTRAPSSLLAILQSNVRPPDQGSGAPPSSSASGRAATWPALLTEPGAHRPVGGHATISGNRPAAPIAPPPENPGRAQASPWVWNGGRSAGQAEAAEADMKFPAADVPPAADFGEQDGGWPVHGGAQPAIVQPPPARNEGGFELPNRATTGAADSGGNLSWPAALPPPDDGAIWQEPTTTTSALSAEQIDQILDALDERLELMLLRMYGTSTL